MQLYGGWECLNLNAAGALLLLEKTGFFKK